MKEQKKTMVVGNLQNFGKDMASLFSSRLGLNDDGSFKKCLSEEEMLLKIKEANTWWTGEDLILKEAKN